MNMHTIGKLVSNKYLFAAIVLTAVLLYVVLAHLYWTHGRHPRQRSLPPEPVESAVSKEDDPAAIAGTISANLEKLLAEKQQTTMSKEALLKKLLRSDRFNG